MAGPGPVPVAFPPGPASAITERVTGSTIDFVDPSEDPGAPPAGSCDGRALRPVQPAARRKIDEKLDPKGVAGPGPDPRESFGGQGGPGAAETRGNTTMLASDSGIGPSRSFPALIGARDFYWWWSRRGDGLSGMTGLGNRDAFLAGFFVFIIADPAAAFTLNALPRVQSAGVWCSPGGLMGGLFFFRASPWGSLAIGPISLRLAPLTFFRPTKPMPGLGGGGPGS